MCFPPAKSTDESDAVIAAWGKRLGGLPSLREHPSEQLPCCEGGGGRSRLPPLAPHCISRCWPSAWHSGRAQGESVLKVNAMSKGHLRVLGGGRRINLYWTPMEHHAKCWAYKARLRTATKCAGPSARWKSVQGTRQRHTQWWFDAACLVRMAWDAVRTKTHLDLTHVFQSLFFLLV